MARNTEKANLMLNRWTAMKEEMSRGSEKRKERRPYLASEVKSLPEAERWRMEVVRDITKKVSEIQNAGLGEARTRDLNDEINKLIREKGHWERQIKALGGPDYGRSAARVFDSDALELPGSGGYKYFGTARELPGVKELFEAAKAKEVRRTRGDIMRGVQPEYYGFAEDRDETVLQAEAAAQSSATASAGKRWEAARMTAHAERMARRAQGLHRPEDTEEDGEEGAAGMDEHDKSTQPQLSIAASAQIASFSTAPGPQAVTALSAEQIEAMLAEKRKQLLLQRYGASGDDL